MFKSHYSIGKSILTLADPHKAKEGGPDSILKIALDNGLKEIVLVEDSLIGFSEAYKRCESHGIKLVFGLRLSMRNEYDEQKSLFKNDNSENDNSDENTENKVIIFAKNNEGCKFLNKIYSKAFTESEGYLTYSILNNMWEPANLKLAIPFYDSFIHTNHFKNDTTAIPNIKKMQPTFFIESNGLAFDHLLKHEVEKHTTKNKYPTQKVKSIFYKNKKDVEALMAYKIICNRSFGKARSLSRPELSHFCSDSFSFESWKEENVKE